MLSCVDESSAIRSFGYFAVRMGMNADRSSMQSGQSWPTEALMFHEVNQTLRRLSRRGLSIKGLYEHCRRHVEPLRQGTDLPDVQFPLAAEDFGHNSLGADLGQVGLGQAVLLH